MRRSSDKAGTAFQFLATISVSIALVVVIVAAFMAAPLTGTLGFAVGIIMVVFTVFELLAFSLLAAMADESASCRKYFYEPRIPLNRKLRKRNRVQIDTTPDYTVY